MGGVGKESFFSPPLPFGFYVSLLLSERGRKRVCAWFGRKVCALRGFDAL
jgi:hypothetical protein